MLEQERSTLGSKCFNVGRTSCISATLNVLIDKHFPQNEDSNPACWAVDGDSFLSESVDSIINFPVVRRDIFSFGSYKTPGPDGIYPIMLKQI